MTPDWTKAPKSATLRSAGLIEPQTDFKGNFVKRGL